MYQGTQPQMFARYNRWMNEKLYEAAATLSDYERKADLGAFFKSIHGTFEHLLWADGAWLARFEGQPVAPPPKELQFPEFEVMRSARRGRDAEILAWADALTPEWLTAPFSWKSVVYQSTFTQPGFAVVSQFFNHQTHHRGQITTLLMQLGVDPGVTDIPMLPELSAGDPA
jgi:uncharacterized damage-inducible protein DinB